MEAAENPTDEDVLLSSAAHFCWKASTCWINKRFSTLNSVIKKLLKNSKPCGCLIRDSREEHGLSTLPDRPNARPRVDGERGLTVCVAAVDGADEDEEYACIEFLGFAAESDAVAVWFLSVVAEVRSVGLSEAFAFEMVDLLFFEEDRNAAAEERELAMA